MSLTDQDILNTIEASVKATSATGIFYNHAFCTLVGMLDVDQKELIEKIRSLSPTGDEFSQTIYSSSKNLLISNIEEMSKK